MTVPVSGVSEIHPLFVVFKGVASNLNWFNFNGVRPPKNRFLRGDANADGTTDLSDAIALLGFLFLGEKKVPCEQAGDVNDDGTLDITDAIHVLNFLFLRGNPIEPPVGGCGVDPTGHALPCESFPGCQ